MEQLISNIGGYASWEFAALALGSLAIGIILRVWKVYFIPIPAFGLLLLTLAVNHSVSELPPNINSMALGIAGTLPVLFAAIGAFVLLDPDIVRRIFFGASGTSGTTEKEK